jgi:D-alanyl-D-alanine-carboxypeptidase/D-alanyl-D-alanine-endopeptidase
MRTSWFCAAIAAVWFMPMLGAAAVSREDLARELTPLLEKRIVQAVSIGVIQPAGSVSGSFGQLTPADPTPPRDDTLYEIGSLSKVFTALLLADAVVRGEVALDLPISALLPKGVVLPGGAGERITLRMLATHTSGLPRIPAELPPDDYTDPYANYGADALWATLRQVRLDFEPGTQAAYSNLAAGLLGTLLAQRAGTTYEGLLRERILAPLGMRETTVHMAASDAARLAPPFGASGSPAHAWNFQALAGAGGIRSTLSDLMRFAQAMLHPSGSPLRAAIELAWEMQSVKSPVSPGGQALGWMIASDRETRWHNGMTGGYHTAMFVNREKGVAVVWLSNRSHPIGTQVAEKLIRQGTGRVARPAPNATRDEVALAAEQIDRCVGTFRVNAQITLVCERRHNALFVTPTGQPTDRLFAAASDTFFSRRAPVELQFELPDSGEVASAVVVTINGRRQRAVRE